MAINYEPPPSRRSLWACLSLLVLSACAVFAACFLVGWYFWPSNRTGLNAGADPRPVAPRGSLSAEEMSNIEIYKQASPCLVQVMNLTVQSNGLGVDAQEVPKGVGSGFVWDHDGHIVTNYHVVEGADVARVTLADHSTYETRQIWAYPDQDMAVLSINAPHSALPPILVGTSHDLQVGQIVFTLGDPFGLDETMTNGIVSALGREMNTANGRVVRGVIQTTAAINPGNSGGPLLDSAGRLIGMNTAIISPSGAFAGIGFAIPVDEINHVVPQLIRHGKVVRPWLGIQLAPDQLAQQLGVDRGILVLKVQSNSPAASAGLQGTSRDKQGQLHLGDVIVAVDGKAINNANDLFAVLEDHHAGDKLTLTLLRDGKQQDVQVTLQAER